MLLRDASILTPVPGTPFVVMAVPTAEDLKAALEFENRDELIQGTEVDRGWCSCLNLPQDLGHRIATR